MYQILSYITFILKSTNQHGVHSPFVYNLVTKCFYDKTKFSEYNRLKSYRKALLKSIEHIDIIDFGAGSKLLQIRRKVSHMVRLSATSWAKTKLLFRLSRYFQFEHTLELGTHLGIGTQALAAGHLKNNITTIEGCENTHKFALAHLKTNNVTFINASFSKVLPKLSEHSFDCIFFDGHHTKKATLEYFNLLKQNVHNDSVFIFDDIYWSKDMTEAWRIICDDKRVTVSIDIFHFGIVFFRKEQPKQHFKIRV